MKKFILFFISLSLLSACTNQPAAEKALRDSGFTNITTGGYGWFFCGKGDFYSTKFTAVNPAGKEVSGVACSGLLKGTTIRF